MRRSRISARFKSKKPQAALQRWKSGKDIARANGKQVDGRPKKYTAEQREHALNLLAEGNNYTSVESMTGISKSTLIREVRKQRAKDIAK